MTDARPVITAEAHALAPRLHEAVAESLGAARRRLQGLDHSTHPALLPLTLRAELRDRLERSGLVNGWDVAGDPRLMEQLLLRHPDSGLVLRFLKERRRTYPGGVPTAGSNRARQKIWHQGALDLGIPGPDLGRVTCLLVWDLRDPANLEDGFTLRLVHTLSAGTYGRAVPCDLSLELLPGGEIHDRLAFTGDNEDTDLFARADEVEIDETAANGS